MKLPCTIPHVLGAFLADNCEVCSHLLIWLLIDQCGEPAKLLMWFSVTPKKVCEKCGKAAAPEFQFLKNMLRYYGLVKQDVKDVPTILRISKSPISLTDLVSPNEGTIMNHSR